MWTLPIQVTLPLLNIFINWASTFFTYGWSGATPYRERPNGTGNFSNRSTWMHGWRLMRAFATKHPLGPLPTMATCTLRLGAVELVCSFILLSLLLTLVVVFVEVEVEVVLPIELCDMCSAVKVNDYDKTDCVWWCICARRVNVNVRRRNIT